MTELTTRDLDWHDLRQCALAWEPGVRLLGNVRAKDIVGFCDRLTAVEATLERVRALVHWFRAVDRTEVADRFDAALGPAPAHSVYEVKDPNGHVVHETNDIEFAASEAQRQGPLHTWGIRCTVGEREAWRARAASGRDPSQVCEECGATHGPGNTNTLCPLASNYRAPAQAAEPIPVVALHLHEARVRELESDNRAMRSELDQVSRGPQGHSTGPMVHFLNKSDELQARVAELEASRDQYWENCKSRIVELEAELASSRVKYDLFKAASLARVAELEAARAPSTLETLTRALSRSAEKNLQLTAQNDEQASTITKHQERVAELETSVATRETWIRLAQEVLRGE